MADRLARAHPAHGPDAVVAFQHVFPGALHLRLLGHAARVRPRGHDRRRTGRGRRALQHPVRLGARARCSSGRTPWSVNSGRAGWARRWPGWRVLRVRDVAARSGRPSAHPVDRGHRARPGDARAGARLVCGTAIDPSDAGPAGPSPGGGGRLADHPRLRHRSAVRVRPRAGVRGGCARVRLDVVAARGPSGVRRPVARGGPVQRCVVRCRDAVHGVALPAGGGPASGRPPDRGLDRDVLPAVARLPHRARGVVAVGRSAGRGAGDPVVRRGNGAATRR
jgi:hypothetical protein